MSEQLSRRKVIARAAGAAAAGLGGLMFQLPAKAGNSDQTIHWLAGPFPLAPGGTDPVIARALVVFRPGVIYSFGPSKYSHVLSVLDREGAIAGQTSIQVGPAGTSGLSAVPLEIQIGGDGSVRLVSRGISPSTWLGSTNGFGGLVLSETADQDGSRFVAGALIASDNADRPTKHVFPFVLTPEQAGATSDSALWGFFAAEAEPTGIGILIPPARFVRRVSRLGLINSAGDFVLAPHTLEPGQRSMIRTLTVTFSGLETRVGDGGRDLLLAGETGHDGMVAVLLLPAVQGGSLRDGAGGAQGGTIHGSGMGALALLSAQNTPTG